MGLAKDWWRVIDTLRRIAPYYRQFNSCISMGRDLEIRRRALKTLHHKPRIILDAGSGDGSLTEILLSEFKHTVELVVALDVLPEMLKMIKTGGVEKVQGVFEYMPFRDCCFDTVTAAFSLRDAIELEKTIVEIYRILKISGHLLVIDLGKPDSSFKKLLVNFYWFLVAPVIAFLRLGLKGLEAWKIGLTLKRYPENSSHLKMYLRYFQNLDFRELFYGWVIVIHAFKASQLRSS
ncbi:MAG: class I SAM-dependent methyltransferase [Nitrososphaerota archaeon]|nr:class I SAM-dependent methyltransferase [Candidatus Geocrenenecus dongiae]